MPAASLLDKAREGIAKGVAPERVCAVVAALADSLTRAAPLVPASIPAREERLVAAAAAMRAGAPSARVAAQARSAQPWATEALYAYADLLTSGFASGDVERLVEMATRAPDPIGAIRGLSVTAAALRTQGYSTTDSLELLMESVSAGHGNHGTGRPDNPGHSDPPDRSNAGGRKT